MQTPHDPHGELVRIRARQQEEVQRRLLSRHQTRAEAGRGEIPVGYQRPAYNTPDYYRDVVRGWISEQEQAADHAAYETRRKRALDSKHNRAKPPHRHRRQAPRPSKQFAKSMSTTAARDDRLTPQAKSLLTIIVARAGQGRSTDTTKTTLGKILNRCPRSIQRYLQDLIKFGYLRTQTIKSKRSGYYVGIRIWLMDSVLPFWAKGQGGDAYDPERWTRFLTSGRNRDETEVSLTKVKDNLLSGLSDKKPPWFQEYAWR